MTSSASKPSAVDAPGRCSASSTSWIRLDLPGELVGDCDCGWPCSSGTPRCGTICRERSKATARWVGLLVAQRVDQHRGEAVDGVGGLAGRRREVLHRQRVEGPVGQRVAVEEQQGRASGPSEVTPMSRREPRRGPDGLAPARRAPSTRVGACRRTTSSRLAATMSAGTLVERLGIEVTEWTAERVVGHHAGRGQHPAVRPPARRRVGGARGDPRIARAARCTPVASGSPSASRSTPPTTGPRPAGTVTGVATPISLGRTLCTLAGPHHRRDGTAGVHRRASPACCGTPRPAQERRRPDTSGPAVRLSTARRRGRARPRAREDAVSRPRRRRSTDTWAIRRVTTGWKPSRA